MKKPNAISRWMLIIIFLSSIVLGGCEWAAIPGIQATSTSIPLTNTPLPTATDTPQPTNTNTPTSLPTDTPTPLPTETPDLGATVAANKKATAEAFNAIVATYLEDYGVNPADGHVVYAGEKPIRLELTSYMENQNIFLDEAGSQTDFVVQSDITWDTTGALSLCGITFHAEEDQLKGAQNRFFMMRLQFSPAWTIWRWEYGQFQRFVSEGWQVSPDIHDENATTNRVALVVHGKDIDLYINNDKQRRVEDAKLTEGLIALSAFQESGHTQCTFTDTWVWVFDH